MDTPLDPDGIVRRNLLFNSDGTTTQHSFALRLVLTYINAGCPGYTPVAGVACQDISENTQTNEYQLGRSIFPKLTTDAGGYQAINASGYKILLDYRSAHHVPVAAPALAVVMVGGSTIACKQYQTQQQQQMVMRLLGQQTSPEIATTLWQGRHHLLKAGRLPWQKLTATVLFSDIKGFSAIAEQQSPEVVMGWLNNYLTVMAEEVQCHKGVTNKFIGDGIMAVFGVPVARTSEIEIAADAQRAVRCALAMRQRLHQMNQNRQRQGLPALQMRVGLFTGPVMVGSLGGKVRLEYGVIGDSVNTASRLESCEKERQVDNCRVLIARETLDYLQGRFEVEPWGHLMLRGKQRSVEVYRVL